MRTARQAAETLASKRSRWPDNEPSHNYRLVRAEEAGDFSTSAPDRKSRRRQERAR